MSAARTVLAAAFAICVFFACAPKAEAQLRLCNRTSYILYASTGVETAGKITTKGWIRIVPGACETAIAGDLQASNYYVYARTSQAHDGPAHAWGGKAQLCAKDTNFAITVAQNGQCNEDGALLMPFMPVDTGGSIDWTTTFTRSPDLKTALAARRAGIARLLNDAGYKTSGTDGPERALAAFRVRMKMPDDAGPDDLFDALETEALKVAAPAGYSVCNDTDAPVWAALGLERGTIWASRGWWKVEPGVCARALTQKLAASAVYLLVEDAHGKKLVTGKTQFCITQIQFDVERREHCKERGLVSAGFAMTSTKGREGYAAHVSEDGLLPAMGGTTGH